MKIVNIEEENLHIFWTTWVTKFSGKMLLIIILKVTKNWGFTLFLQNAFLENLQGDQIDPSAFLGLKIMKNAFYFTW